jgi:hypothetical protein
MKIGAYLGNQAHAPANSRTALISAYAGGSELLSLAVRPTADGRIVLAQADDVSAATGTTGTVSTLGLSDLRDLDFSETFTPRGNAPGEFHYFDPTVSARRFVVDVLDDVLSELPRDVDWLVEVRGGNGATGSAVADQLRSHGALSRAILAFESAAEVANVKASHPTVRTALLALDGTVPGGEADLLVLGGKVGNGALVDLAVASAGGFPMGVCLAVLGDTVEDGFLDNAASKAGIFGVLVRSTFDFQRRRTSYVHVDESFKGTTVDRTRFALGYAKANGYGSVTWNDGVHVDIKPYDGPVPHNASVTIEERLSQAEWAIIDIGRTWPFYSGGGVGLTLGIRDDFAAEVTYTVDQVAQATTLEMAFTNVDPGAHQARPPTSFRQKDVFFDPHGAPPFVGVEHDEDNGFRINWNLGVDYDNNQYGRPVGDGVTPRGARMRVERRGAYFAAYYRMPVDARGGRLPPNGWVCVGVVRNDSLNRTIYARCVGKRWRQEKADNPSEHEPIIPNRFTFRDFSVVCFPNGD